MALLGAANDPRREAEVAEADVVRRGQEHVLRFDVPVVQVVIVLRNIRLYAGPLSFAPGVGSLTMNCTAETS